MRKPVNANGLRRHIPHVTVPGTRAREIEPRALCRWRGGMGNGGADTKKDPQGRGTRRTFSPWTDPTARALVRFDGVSKQFTTVAAVERVSLDIFAGEFFALLGPSGCGKT